MKILKVVSVLVIIFGLLTLKEGGSVAFNIGSARINSGNYIPFVVWFNFISGFFYITAGIGLWLKKNWALKLSNLILISILVTYFLLFIHIFMGGLYETRTVLAMAFRTAIWAFASFIAFKTMVNKESISANLK